MSVEDLIKAPVRVRGHVLEDFEPGRAFEHHWGRTITEQDAILFATCFLQFNKIYYNREAAKAAGHPDCPIPPMLLFATVFGLSVEDLSERGGAFLGIDDLAFVQPAYPGDTFTARSTVLSRRQSDSRPGYGIATWLTEGFNQRGEQVISFKRTNMVIRAQGAEL